VYGDSGIGKTLALQAVAADKPGSALVSIESLGASGAAQLNRANQHIRVTIRNPAHAMHANKFWDRHIRNFTDTTLVIQLLPQFVPGSRLIDSRSQLVESWSWVVRGAVDTTQSFPTRIARAQQPIVPRYCSIPSFTS